MIFRGIALVIRQVTSSFHCKMNVLVNSQCIQEYLGAFFNVKIVFNGVQEKLFVCDGIEKSVPRDHQFLTLGKPCVANK